MRAADPLEAGLLRTLRAAYQHAAATDAANAAASLAEEVLERPLTRELRETHDVLSAALTATPPRWAREDRPAPESISQSP
jgi:hypothetical protein